jgi:predicted enzyme involved in methoxymalonyl-ACP biosynthesis
MVMSCRVAGLGLEYWMLKTTFDRMEQDTLMLAVVETGRNQPFLDFCGSVRDVMVNVQSLPDLAYIQPVTEPGL